MQDVSLQTILVVDDSKSILSFLQDHLTEANYQVIAAENGMEALSMLADHHVDIIISDMQMPQMDGPSFRRKLLSHPQYTDIPFVAMSSNQTDANFKAMRELHAAAFLAKPFKPEQLFILLDRLRIDSDRIRHGERSLARLEKKMLLNSIMSLAQALDARDSYTRSHSDSVSRLAVVIARQMHFSTHDISQVFVAGRLHDLGKIGIPDSILQKPDGLNLEEYEAIKSHPAVGARILDPIPSLKDVAEMIHSHHERPDGLGYPRGLTGKEIHPLAHILAIADVFDALTSDRPYRAAYDRQQALTIMAETRGTQFHPESLDAFFRAVREGKINHAAHHPLVQGAADIGSKEKIVA